MSEAGAAQSVLLEERAARVHQQHVDMTRNLDILRRNIKRVLAFLEQAAPTLRAQMVERLSLHQLVMATAASLPLVPPPIHGGGDGDVVANTTHLVLQSEPLRLRLIAAWRGEFPATVYQSLTKESFALFVPLLHSMIRTVSMLRVGDDGGGGARGALEVMQRDDFTAALHCLCEGSYRFPDAFADPARRHQHRGLVMDLENARDTLGALSTQLQHVLVEKTAVGVAPSIDDGAEDEVAVGVVTAVMSPCRKKTRPEMMQQAALTAVATPTSDEARLAMAALIHNVNNDASGDSAARIDSEALLSSLARLRGLHQSTTDVVYRIRSLAQI